MIESATARRVAEDLGTPVYVYDADVIKNRFAALKSAFDGVPHRLHFAVKSNSNHAVLSLIREQGAGADIVSGGELRRCLRAGFVPGDIVFSGVGKSATELEQAVVHEIAIVNVESRAEIQALLATCERLDRGARIGLRINPDLKTETHPYTQTSHGAAKFGVPRDEVADLVDWIEGTQLLNLVSVGAHLGSQILDAAPFESCMEYLSDVVSLIRDKGIQTLETLDIGGGFGIDYGGGLEFDPQSLKPRLASLHKSTGLKIIAEPGRFVVGPAGSLLTRVVYLKRAAGRNIVVVDGAMNDLIRPSLYNATHPVRLLREAASSYPADIVGPVCETGDFLARDIELDASPEVGDLIEVGAAGAYGFSMSSQYNSRPRAPEVMVMGDQYAVVRRRETLEDITRAEVTEPAWHRMPG